MNKSLFSTLFLFLLLTCAYSQDSTAVDVTEIIGRRELDMKIYPPDTTAQAVVLFDLGRLSVSYEGRFILSRTRQVKILKQSGFTNYGHFELYLDVNNQAINSLKARVMIGRFLKSCFRI
jgi:hypothetical protein